MEGVDLREFDSMCCTSSISTKEEWRMCTNLQAINKITIKYRFPLPRMDDIMDYSVDLKSGYH